MKRWTFLLLLLLLPIQGLAVVENVVESAPNIEIKIGKQTDALFGAWEQGLSDIRAAAQNAARVWKREEMELSLKEITLRNSPMDDDPGNDEIVVTFTYTSDGVRRLLHVDYLRGTGEVIGLTDVRDNSFVQRESEAIGSVSLTDDQLEQMAIDFLLEYYGETASKLEEIIESENKHNWIARFAAERGLYEVVLSRKTGDAVRVSLSVGEVTK